MTWARWESLRHNAQIALLGMRVLHVDLVPVDMGGEPIYESKTASIQMS